MLRYGHSKQTKNITKSYGSDVGSGSIFVFVADLNSGSYFDPNPTSDCHSDSDSNHDFHSATESDCDQGVEQSQSPFRFYVYLVRRVTICCVLISTLINFKRKNLFC